RLSGRPPRAGRSRAQTAGALLPRQRLAAGQLRTAPAEPHRARQTRLCAGTGPSLPRLPQRQTRRSGLVDARPYPFPVLLRRVTAAGIATWVVRAGAAYAGIGLVFAAYLLARGLARFDAAAVQAGWGFK